MNKLSYIESTNYNPYHNLALENYLMDIIDDNEIIMYLWQNKNTIVIGKNQNIYTECYLDNIQKDNIFIARRNSGGGCVYHDLGNLNFSFITSYKNYNLKKQLSVIIDSLSSFGINAKFSGRNDILIDNHKFSGNAYYTNHNAKLHHGTIMVDVNLNNLNKYLNISKDKLTTNSIQSTPSKIINLNSINNNITIKSLKDALINSFSFIYNTQVTTKNINQSYLNNYISKFSSIKWIYNENKVYTYKLYNRYSWGNIDININIKNNIINDIYIYSDSLDYTINDILKNLLLNCKFNKIDIIKSLKKSNRDEINDIINLINESVR